MNFLVAIHLFIAFALIVLVLLQDSKGGGALGIGGGSNSFLGATGAQTLYARMTRWAAALFGISCIMLSVQITREGRSVIDTAPVINSPPAASAPAATATETTAAPATTEKAPAAPADKTK